MHSSIKIINPEGISTKFVPTKIKSLDYIAITIIVKKQETQSSPESIKPTACSAKTLSAQLIHQKCGQFFHGRITELAKNKFIDGLPVNIPQLTETCPICIATKSNHHPRKQPRDYTLLKPGQQMHMDFYFVPVVSIRGNIAMLCIKCAHTKKAWCFPCPNKRTPLDIVSFFIRFLEKDGIYILEIRVDEDGALANSTEFCKMLHVNGIALQTTGGYSSDLNGNVEILNKTLKRGTGALLANAGLKDVFWCYAAIHFCNLINYMSYNHDKTMTVFQAWYGKRPHWKNFRVFGSDIYVVNENTSKNSLTKATRHIFLGWGTSTSTIHYLDPQNDEIKRARHAYFDDYSSSIPEADLTPGARLIRNTSLETIPIDTNVINLHTVEHTNPFTNNKLHHLEIDMTCCSSYPFRVKVTFDEFFRLPFIKQIQVHSPWYINLPGNFRRNVWILSINAIEPITPTAVYESIAFYLQTNITIKVTLSKWEPVTRTKLDSYRSQFDQIRPTPLHSVPPAKSAQKPISPQGNFAIFAPQKPTAPAHIGEIFKSPLNIEWKKSLWQAYDKNAKVGTFTAPFPKEDVHIDQKILESRVTFKFKTMDTPNTWDLYNRHCANGGV